MEEDGLGGSGHHEVAEGIRKEEKDDASVSGDEENCREDAFADHKDERIKSARARVDEAMRENQRLKVLLSQVTRDYRSLEIQYHKTLRGIEAQRASEDTDDLRKIDEEPEALVSLSLGRSVAYSSRKDNLLENKNLARAPSQLGNKEDVGDGEGDHIREGLTLGLKCKSETPGHPGPDDTNGSSAAGRPSEVMRAVKSDGHGNRPQNQEILQQNNIVKRVRVSVRAKCDAPTMNDGCQWRKYGQKIAKGNPCPRAYYRCTISHSCPVRKQVQRCPEDMDVLISTYEGTHNHPIPMAATAMASTTAAAASMLLSSPSSSSHSAPLESGATFYLAANGLSSKPVLVRQCSPLSSSNSSSHPTVILDLTSTSSPLLSTSLNRFGLPNQKFYLQPQSYPFNTSLSFGTSYSNEDVNSRPFSWPWYNDINGFLAGCGNSMTKHQGLYLGGSSSNPREQTNASINIYQSLLQKNKNPVTNQAPPSLVPSLSYDSMATAIKAITTDPAFQSVLAATLSSIMVNNGGNENSSRQITNLGDGGGRDTELSQQSSKFSEYHSAYCQPEGPVVSRPPSSAPPFSSSESASGSPSDRRTKDQSDH